MRSESIARSRRRSVRADSRIASHARGSVHFGPVQFDDAHAETLPVLVTGRLGGQVGIAPRLFVSTLVANRVGPPPDQGPRRRLSRLQVEPGRHAAAARGAALTCSPEDIELHL